MLETHRGGGRALSRSPVFRGSSMLWRIVCLVVVGMMMGRSALAACTDPAAPEVQWLRCYIDGRSLVNADLTRAKVRESTFQRSDLSRVKFSEANAYRSKMISARMVEANLDGAAFIEADFTRADLTRASLNKTDLRRARFYHAILREANLTGARLEGAELLNADLTGAVWTDGVRVCGANSIGQCN